MVAEATTHFHSNRSFIAHREEISNLGLRWATAQPRGTSSLSITPFYSASTNDTDLAHLFGSNGDGGITVTKEVRPTVDTIHDAVYSFNIDHAPNADGVSPEEIPLSGIVTFRPRRTTLGAWCSMRHSLDSLVSGLSFSLHASFTRVHTCMRPRVSNEEPSNVRQGVDGTSAATLIQYFNGALSKSLGTTTHVQQAPLRKHRFNETGAQAVGVGDILASLHWNGIQLDRITAGVSALIQVPTGNMPSGDTLFEPIYGARGHFAGGAGVQTAFTAYDTYDTTVRFVCEAEWKYYFSGTEHRTVGIYDTVAEKTIPSGWYRNSMEHAQREYNRPQTSFSLEHTVTPGHQGECVIGFTARLAHVTCALGYNLFLKEKK